TILWACWKLAGKGRWLAWALGLAFVLRLASGVGLMSALPIYGHDTEQQKAGYVFFDSFRRDTQAQELSQTRKPILSAITKKYATDQYGGYMALSMFVYRYASGGVPRPYLMLILSALAGAAALAFFRLLAARVMPERGAQTGVWLLALFPQSVLLGASQMREPWLILFVTVCLWAASEWIHAGGWKPLLILGGSSALILLISPAILLPLFAFLLGWWLIDRRGRKIPVWVYPVIIGLVLLGVFVFSWSVAKNNNTLDRYNMVEVMVQWFQNAMTWDVQTTTADSGRLEYLFAGLPSALHTPFVVVYGVLQPVLPAALLDTTLFIWNLISSLLAAGWYWILPLLAYAVFAWPAGKTRREKFLFFWMTLIVWGWIVLSSARAGGDQWDNPRYRTIFLPLMAWLIAWVWDLARSQHFYWLKFIWLMEAVALLFFTQWYASRYYQLFGRMQFPQMVGVIIILWIIILIWAWWGARQKKRLPVQSS
ncbi:MAG TPA: hypothetical protein VFF78_02540, partial [Anaerolineaceae bacterium]|nr:hypothetical protein [Anaerolineaceae bacterium]